MDSGLDRTLDRELELREHIRSLLLQYALTHLATNYVTWTQEAVTNILSESLVFAPTHAPTEVTLPVDPFEVLSQRLGLSKLDIYEERWKVDNPDVLYYLRGQMAVLRGQEVAENTWQSDHDENYDAFLLSRPMSPILSCRSKRETPLSNGTIGSARLPQNASAMLQTWSIHRAEDVAFDEVNVNVDDALGNKLGFDAESHQAILTLLRTVPAASAQTDTVSTTRNFDEFLRADTPPPETLEPQMLPIFPRVQQPGRSAEKPGSGKTSFVASLEAATKLPASWLSTVEIREEDEDDIANEHLALVGGCDSIKTPSSPLTLGTPSLVDTSSDIDELFLPSSPGVGVEPELRPMEEFQLPKTERFGRRCSKSSRLGDGRSLSSFIVPLICPVQVPGAQIPDSPHSRASTPRASLTVSMLGQPSSVKVETQDPTRIGNGTLSSDDSIAFATKIVERACADHLGDDDPYGQILAEKIDEKDEYMMNVPTMRPPNEHYTSAALPAGLSDLVLSIRGAAAAGDGQSAHTARYSGFLEKVKGLQSLQLELSWIPFKYGRTVPTDEEAADVAESPSAELIKTIDLPKDDIASQLSELLDDGVASCSQTMSTLVWSLDDNSDLLGLPTWECLDDIGFVLTRCDRRRLYGLPSPVDWAKNDEDTRISDKENDELFPLQDPSDGCHQERPVKRVRFEVPDDLQDIPSSGLEETVDDSGVFFAESEPLGGGAHSVGSFVQMAYDAEGFDGPDTDGNLFLDMEPVDCDDYGSDLCLDDRPYFPASPNLESAFPIDFLLHNTAFAPASPKQSQIPLGTAAADEASFEHPASDSGTVSAASIACLPLPSTAPSAVSQSPLYALSGPETVVNEHGPRVPPSTSAATAPLAFSARQSLSWYLAAMKPDVSAPTSTLAGQAAGSELTTPEAQATLASTVPAELLDDRTLVLQGSYERPSTRHKYMASLSLVQKRALVRALTSCCAVDLVERERLGDGNQNPGLPSISDSEDLILDCDTAVLFASLELLPSRAAGLLELLARLSWRYSHLLVVFECYPSAWDYSGDTAGLTSADRRTASVWSPPVVKAVKNFRRGLSIAEGLQTKSEACAVGHAFAHSAEEAAAFARMFGDAAEARDATGGAIWGERLWLMHEEHDGEYELCRVDGMNLFASSLLLTQVSLEDLLEKTPEDRVLEYGHLVGVERLVRFNSEMARRLEVIQLPPSSPISSIMGGTASSLHSVPVVGDSETWQDG